MALPADCALLQHPVSVLLLLIYCNPEVLLLLLFLKGFYYSEQFPCFWISLLPNTLLDQRGVSDEDECGSAYCVRMMMEGGLSLDAL